MGGRRRWLWEMGVMGEKEEVVVGDGCDGWKEEVVVGDGCDG